MFYIFFSFIVDTILLQLDNLVDIDLIYKILSGYTIIEYSLFSYFLYSILGNKIFRVIILVLTIGFYLFDQLNKPQVMFIYQDANFWFVIGFMVYLSGTLFLFIQANELERVVRDNFWKINHFSNITKNILFAIAFSIRKDAQNKKSLFESPFEDIFDNSYKSL